MFACPLLRLLFGFNIYESNPCFIGCYSYDELRDILSFVCYNAKKSKQKPFSAFCGHPSAFFETMSLKTSDILVSLNCDNLEVNSG